MNLHIQAELRRWQRGIDLYVIDRSHEHVAVMVDSTFQTVEPGAEYPENPLHLSNSSAQELMDSLWECGLRPSEGSGSAGALLATQNHLKDMQSLSWRLLTVIERKA